MFQTGLRESSPLYGTLEDPILIPDVSPEAFLTILEFLYAGSAKLYVRTAFQVCEIGCALSPLLVVCATIFAFFYGGLCEVVS